MTKNSKDIQGVEDTCLAIKLRIQDQFSFPVCNVKLFQQTNRLEVRNYWYKAHGAENGIIGIQDEKIPFSKIGNTSHHNWKSIVGIRELHLVAITMQELHIEGERLEEQNKAKEVMLAERRRTNLEAAAAKAGLTVEEYEAERVRRAEEAMLQIERIQAEKVQPARMRPNIVLKAKQKRTKLEAAAANTELTVKKMQDERARKAGFTVTAPRR